MERADRQPAVIGVVEVPVPVVLLGCERAVGPELAHRRKPVWRVLIVAGLPLHDVRQARPARLDDEVGLGGCDFAAN